MAADLTRTFPRLWTIDAGVVMVVTDLHGDWDTYARCRDRFVDRHAAGQVDWLVFTGDMIHREPGDDPDRSLEIMLDVLALRAAYGDAIIVLCGNHELPHLYGIILGKGRTLYTPSFEIALTTSGRRADALAFFDTLPFQIATRAGVTITHASASPDCPDVAPLLGWDHHAVRAWADAQLGQTDRDALRRGYAELSDEESYAAMARAYLAVAGEDDPRYDDLLRGMLVTTHPAWPMLRAALFTRCEQAYGEHAYVQALDTLLHQLSAAASPQRLLVAGHMRVAGGHAVVGR